MNPAEAIKEWTQKAKQFYFDVRSEMKKVSWPSRQEVTGTTLVVIIAVFFFGLYLGLVDYLLAMGLDRVLRYFRVTGGA
jgi:preprotein translocase subunit SecE